MTTSVSEGGEKPIVPVFRNKSIMIFRCEDLWYPEYRDKFFVLEKSDGYGYFDHMTEKFTRGEIMDNYKITLP